MAFGWTAYRTAMRAAVALVWPEAITNGVWPLARIQRNSFEGIDVPFVSIDYGAALESDEWSGITRQAYLIEPVFYYVFQIDLVTDYEEHAAAKAEALEDYLLANDPAVGQVIDVLAQDVTPDDALMALILDRQKPYFAGAVTAQILVGE